jgi:hypothetical protein
MEELPFVAPYLGLALFVCGLSPSARPLRVRKNTEMSVKDNAAALASGRMYSF